MEKNSKANEKNRKSECRSKSVPKEGLDETSLSRQQSNVNVHDKSDKTFSSYVKLYKVDDSTIEVSEEMIKEKVEDMTEEKLSGNQSFSKNKKNQTEIMDVSSVRMTRSRRSSVIKDISARQIEPEKVTRLRRSSSTMKDPLNFSTDHSSQKTDFEISSRLKRANSAAKEIKMDSPSGKLRGRRANSLAKDILMSSVISLDENCESGNSNAQPSMRRGRRCTSVTKEYSQPNTKDSDSESIKDELPVRRSTRLASSARKELQADTPSLGERSFTKSGSATWLVKLANDDEEGENANKRSLRRTRKSSVSSDTDGATTNRSLRLSMRDKECSKEPDIKTTRKRGSSVPKEMKTQPIGSLRRRSSSIIKEIIPEVAEPPEESKKSRNSAARNTEEIVDRLTTNARVRSASVLSVPEELEEILSPSIRETRSTRKKAVQNNAREKRASSADVTHTDMKRRVRNVDTSITVVSPIAEELVEGNEKIDIETVQDTPAPKRKTASVTTIKEMKTNTVKSRRGRPRKISVSQESSNLYSFSLPEKTDDVPLEKGNLKN